MNRLHKSVLFLMLSFPTCFGIIKVRIEFSPTDHICDKNDHYGLMETTDRDQLKVTFLPKNMFEIYV